jgi:hypothetical protein
MDPEEDEKVSNSDGYASEDNFDLEELYKEVYMRGDVMEKELKQRSIAEEKFYTEIKKLLKE